MKPSQNINISRLSFDQKVEKSNAVIKEAMELYGSEYMALAITGGKDSTTNLWLFKKMCKEYGLKLPLCMFIDEGDFFDEIREFVDFHKARWNLEITLVKNRDPILQNAQVGGGVAVSSLNMPTAPPWRRWVSPAQNSHFSPTPPSATI